MNIFVAGHGGMVGSAIVKALSSNNSNNIVTATRERVDLLNQKSVNNFFAQNDIDQVIAAAKVGGIHANNEYMRFIYENLMIQSNIIHSAHLADVKQLLFWGVFLYFNISFQKQPLL